ncbi:MAG TPA: hypothetical protein G4O12_01650 [Dehalococcoidia bacterium]|nr:hypothetical protein [Dehalococcoidia bacterium]
MNEHDIRYVLSLSLEEAAFGCEKITKIKTGEVCSSCEGSGRSSTLDSTICPKCHGIGQIYQSYPISVHIPAGVKDGYQLHVNTKDQAGLRGEVLEELDVIVSIRAHKVFQRSDDDVIYEMPLNFAQAALGAELMVPTLKGSVKLRIPPGTQTGRLFRLKGKGIPHLDRRGKGDQLVKIRVVTPTSLGEHQRWLLERLAKSLSQAELGERKSRR